MWCSTIGSIMLLLLSLLVAPLTTEAQPTRKMPRIGVLVPGVPPRSPGDVLASAGVDRFRQGLRDLGYVEEQTIALEVRWDEHHPERWPELAADLVRQPVDLLVVGTTAAAERPSTSPVPCPLSWRSVPIRSGRGWWPAWRSRGGTSRGLAA